MHAEVLRGQMGAKLAFARLSLNYFLREKTVRYIVDAVNPVADAGAALLRLYRFDPGTALLPLYRFDPGTGLWRDRVLHARHRPGDRAPRSAGGGAPDIRDAAGAAWTPSSRPAVPTDFERIRWFPFPGHAVTPVGAPSALPCRPRP